MKRKNLLVMTLAITSLLIGTIFTGFSAIADPDVDVPSLLVVKDVYDGQDWVDEITANLGDTVQFRITVTYNNETASAHYAQDIWINDTLPPCLDYDVGTATGGKPPVSIPLEPVIDGKDLIWHLGSTVLYDDQSYEIIFNCSVVSYGENINLAEAEAFEHCRDRRICDDDTAIVNVREPEPPSIDVEKKVFDGCEWVETVWAYPCTDVKFNITVENDGTVDLINIFVNDTLPDSLEYNNSATVNGAPMEPDYISPDGKELSWYWNILAPGEFLYIEFDAHVIGFPCSEDINWVEATGEDICGLTASDKDSASVHIYGMCMEKEVWDEEIDAWMEETHAEVGQQVRFRIRIHYYGPNAMKLYDFEIKDVLPPCIDYANDATVNGDPHEPEICGDGKILWWNITDIDLYNGDSLIIEFDGLVSDNQCEPCENWAYVTAIECGVRQWEWADPATVIPECAYMAEVIAPGSADIDEVVTIEGKATGGSPPYTYEWDLDDDGDYDDATGEIITHSWDTPGNKKIKLKVTDQEPDNAYATANIEINNQAPDKPGKPSGTTSGEVGEEYTYTATATTDPEGHQVYYKFSWGDGTVKDWFGPFNAGDTVTAKHKWASKGSYKVKVQARDEYDAESDWSDELDVSISGKGRVRPIFFENLLRQLIQRFPILAKMLEQFF